MAKRKKRVSTNGAFRKLSEPEIKDLIDANARKFLGVDGDEFLRLRKEGKTIESPAWAPIDMLASLLSQ